MPGSRLGRSDGARDRAQHGAGAARYDWRGNILVILHNFAGEPCEVALEAAVCGSETLIDLLKQGTYEAEEGVHRIVMEAYGYDWYRVGGLDYALRRRRM